MKRIVAAASFAMLAVPALAAEVGAPYEMTQFDRGLPTAPAQVRASSDPAWASDYNFIAPAQ